MLLAKKTFLLLDQTLWTMYWKLRSVRLSSPHSHLVFCTMHDPCLWIASVATLVRLKGKESNTSASVDRRPPLISGTPLFPFYTHYWRCCAYSVLRLTVTVTGVCVFYFFSGFKEGTIYLTETPPKTNAIPHAWQTVRCNEIHKIILKGKKKTIMPKIWKINFEYSTPSIQQDKPPM